MSYSTSTYSGSEAQHSSVCGVWTNNLCNCNSSDSSSSVNTDNLGVHRQFGHRTPAGMSYMEYGVPASSAVDYRDYYSSSSSGQGPSGYGGVGYQSQERMAYPQGQVQQPHPVYSGSTGQAANPYHLVDNPPDMADGAHSDDGSGYHAGASNNGSNHGSGQRSSAASDANSVHSLQSRGSGKGHQDGKDKKDRKDRKDKKDQKDRKGKSVMHNSSRT